MKYGSVAQAGPEPSPKGGRPKAKAGRTVNMEINSCTPKISNLHPSYVWKVINSLMVFKFNPDPELPFGKHNPRIYFSEKHSLPIPEYSFNAFKMIFSYCKITLGNMNPKFTFHLFTNSGLLVPEIYFCTPLF